MSASFNFALLNLVMDILANSPTTPAPRQRNIVMWNCEITIMGLCRTGIKVKGGVKKPVGRPKATKAPPAAKLKGTIPAAHSDPWQLLS